MQLFLGIDGGGTGCRAAVANAAGAILGRGVAGPANIASDPEGAAANILAAMEGALAEAGGGEIAAAGLGLAGANAAGATERLRAARLAMPAPEPVSMMPPISLLAPRWSAQRPKPIRPS